MSAATPAKPTEPWRQRLIRSLLYGRNVDRAAKARARVGFVILAFALVYSVIAIRLVIPTTPAALRRRMPSPRHGRISSPAMARCLRELRSFQLREAAP